MDNTIRAEDKNRTEKNQSLYILKDENITFRILSAIGIICVVMGHVKCLIFEFESWTPYYSFHMPLFVFISGYFYSKENDKMYRRFVIHKIKTILVPFYCVSLFYLLIQSLLVHYGVTFGWQFSVYNWIVLPWIRRQPIGFNVATWFMLSLFIVEVVYGLTRYVLRQIRNDKVKDIALLLLFVLVASFVVENSPHQEYLYRIYFRALYLVCFYHIGFCYKKYIENQINISNVALFCVLVVFRAIISSAYGDCA